MGDSGGSKASFNYGVDPSLAVNYLMGGANGLQQSQKQNLPQLLTALSDSSANNKKLMQNADQQLSIFNNEVNTVNAQAQTAKTYNSSEQGMLNDYRTGLTGLLGLDTQAQNANKNNAPNGQNVMPGTVLNQTWLPELNPNNINIHAPGRLAIYKANAAATNLNRLSTDPAMGMSADGVAGTASTNPLDLPQQSTPAFGPKSKGNPVKSLGETPQGAASSRPSPGSVLGSAQTVNNTLPSNPNQQPTNPQFSGQNSSTFNPITGYQGQQTSQLMNTIEGNPVYQAQYNLGLQALQRQMGASGGFNGGGALLQAQNYGQQLAGNVYNGIVSNYMTGNNQQLTAAGNMTSNANNTLAGLSASLGPLASAYGSAATAATEGGKLTAMNALTANQAQNAPAQTGFQAGQMAGGYIQQSAVAQAANNAQVASALIGALL